MEENSDKLFTMTVPAPEFLKSIKILARMGKGQMAISIKDGRCLLMGPNGSVEMNAQVSGEGYFPFNLTTMRRILRTYKKEKDIITINEKGISCGGFFSPLTALQ